MRNFYITGYPRCRSAWLSALMTACGAPCVHEPFAVLSGVANIQEVYELGFAGIADTSGPLLGERELSESLEGCSTLVIARPIRDSRYAFTKWLGYDPGLWEEREAAMDRFIERFSPLVIPFSALSEYETIDKITTHLLGKKLDRNIYDAFKFLNVQQCLNSVLKEVFV